MTISTITPLPTAPSRDDAPATFISRANAFLAAMVTMGTELNTSIGQMNTDIAGVNTDATNAATSASAAAASAESAAATSNAALWVSGQSYSAGDNAISGINFKTYRAITATSGTTDPSASADWIPIIEAAASLTAVASGTLANGDTVIVNSDGTVSAVSSTIVADLSAGTPVVYKSSASYNNSMIYDSTNNKVIALYREVNVTGYLECAVGTVSGDSISFGSAVVAAAEPGSYITAVYDSSNSKIVVFYRNRSTSSGRAVVGTVSGTSSSWGSITNFNGGNTEQISATFDTNSGKAIVGFKDVSAGDAKAVIGTVSGTSISFTGYNQFESGSILYPSCTFDSNLNKVIFFYSDEGNSEYGTAVVGEISGTSLTFGTPVNLGHKVQYTGAGFDSNSNKVVLTYADFSNSEYITAIVGTVSGNSISFGTATAIENSVVRDSEVTFDSGNNTIVATWLTGTTGKAAVGTISGTSISFDTPITFTSSTPYNMDRIAYDSSSKVVVAGYRDTDNLSYGTCVVMTTETTTTNLTSENYIGISDDAYSDTETATVQIVGSVDDAQTGLTAGQSYYVQIDGTLSETPDSPSVFAGTAVSSTEVIIKG